jgi:hypothetical protein
MQILIILKKYIRKLTMYFYILLFLAPISAFSEPLKFRSMINIQSKKSFPQSMNNNSFLNDSIGIQASKNFHNFKTNLTLSIEQTDKKYLLYDHSFIEYKHKNNIYGIGKIDRNWSFSNYTSLILSNNARPSNSIYFLKENSTSNGLLSSLVGPWSFEAFNSVLSSSSELKNPMLLGMRLIIEPYHNLKFELLKTSQWGGSGNSNSYSAFSSAIIGNTNESNNSNINQMAGFGMSFENNIIQMPNRTYAQVVGEDEAGSFPSCLIGLFGSEFTFKNKLLSKIGFEYIDTRIDTTEHGYCGPQTAYNNTDYPYTNYGKSMGASIDSEGKQYSVWATTKISENTKINYSIKNITINDFNSLNHRLSNTKENGWVTSLGTSWKLNSLNVNAALTYQNLHLVKAQYHDGLSLNISANYNF